MLIENISNADGITGNDNNTFDIGGFSLIQAQPAPDEKLDFTVQIADADGHTNSASFSIGIDGTGVNDNDSHRRHHHLSRKLAGCVPFGAQPAALLHIGWVRLDESQRA